MRAVIQRVCSASVSIASVEQASIGQGLLVLLAVDPRDSEADCAWLSQKIVSMRIFNDAQGKMNLSLNDIDGELLLVSQFTLFASTKKGNRPSFNGAAEPGFATPLYNRCIEAFEQRIKKPVKTGVFAAEMQVSLINDGPVTILLDSHDRV